MSEAPWISLIGLGEDGLDGLSPASRHALEAAEIVMGPPRHLGLVPDVGQDRVAWPVPFCDGIAVLRGFEGRRVAILVSGDPFWFGAGSVLARHFPAQAWQAFPGVSCFALAAARLGWALDQTTCLGLHAAPLPRLRRHLAAGQKLMVTLRDGDTVLELGRYLTDLGFGPSLCHVLEHLGGPQERVSQMQAAEITGPFSHPVLVAVEVARDFATPSQELSCATGQRDDMFDNEGQITKQPVRAITLAALAPRPGALLWDIGGGSGSISIEWLLSHPTTQAICLEARADRIALIDGNAARLGVRERLTLIEAKAPEALMDLEKPDAVFIGGGLSAPLLQQICDGAGFQLVANAVTLESEALLAAWQAKIGGDLLRIDLAHARALGPRRGWQASYPVTQWSVTL